LLKDYDFLDGFFMYVIQLNIDMSQVRLGYGLFVVYVRVLLEASESIGLGLGEVEVHMIERIIQDNKISKCNIKWVVCICESESN
jgi:hypothetical protein